MDIVIRIGAALILLALLAGIGWILMHLRKIRKTLVADEAMPKSAPRANLLVLLIAVCAGIGALLVRIIISPR